MNRYVGTWHIDDMEQWDEDYFNMEVQAYIHIQPDGLGNFQFGLVSGHIDGEVVSDGRAGRFEFTWEGQDEMDPVAGSGWLERKDEQAVVGRIKFHLGDSSVFHATRTE